MRGGVGMWSLIKPIFYLATLFARREAKTRIRQPDWLKLAGENIRREQVGNVPTFLSVRANKVAKWKIGFSLSRREVNVNVLRFGKAITIEIKHDKKNTMTVNLYV